MYDHGAADAGRGRFNRSKDGSRDADATGLVPSLTGVPAVDAEARGAPVRAAPNGATRSTSGRASASSSPYRSAMHPVTTNRAPGRRRSESSSTVSIDSWRAASMKAQVLTTTRSASSGASAATRPSITRVPTSLSESTWFLGQPNVSIQYRSATRTIYWAMGYGNASRPGWGSPGPERSFRAPDGGTGVA
jgi:hypothetical protein